MCYEHETLRFEQPLFKSIPRSFLITTVGSTRREQYLAQLHHHPPTAEVIVVKNRGYKTCEKPDWVTTPAADLWDANLHVAAYAQRLGKEPVLILEDDVIFTDEIRSHATSIEKFLLEQSHEPVAYKLGCLPLLSSPVPDPAGHIRVFADADTHAVLYNRAALQKFDSVTSDLKKATYAFHDAVLYHHLKVYMSPKPCAIQYKDFSTENAQQWNWSRIPELTFFCLGGESMAYYRNAHACYGGILPWAFFLVAAIAISVTTCVRYTLETDKFKSRTQL